MERVVLNLEADDLKANIIGLYNLDIYEFAREIKAAEGVAFWKKNYSIVDSKNMKFHTKTVRDEINRMCRINKIKDKSFKKTIERLFEILELDISIIKRKISEISTSDMYKLYLVLKTAVSKDYYIFNDFTRYLDRNGIKCFLRLLSLLRANEKTVFIADSDVNVLYNYTNIIVYQEGYDFKAINVNQQFVNDKIFSDNNIPFPTLVEITSLARKNKNVRLSYHKDVRDIMKDIYKHV